MQEIIDQLNLIDRFKFVILSGDQEKKDFLKKKIREIYKNHEFQKIKDLGEKNCNASSIFSTDLFSTKKLIFIENPKLELVNISLENINKTEIICIFDLDHEDQIRKLSQIKNNKALYIECKPFSKKDREDILREKISNIKSKLSDTQIQNLIKDLSQQDLSFCTNEINKLIVFLSKKDNISDEELEQLIDLKSSSKINDLMRSIFLTNINTEETLINLIQTNHPNLILKWLYNTFFDLYKTSITYGNQNISLGKNLNIIHSQNSNQEEKTRLIKVLQELKKEKIYKILNLITKTDIEIKTNQKIGNIFLIKALIEIKILVTNTRH
jgi:DNA polymerase III delta subunit